MKNNNIKVPSLEKQEEVVKRIKELESKVEFCKSELELAEQELNEYKA